MTSSRVDILVVADPRFSGGTAASLVSDVRAFSDLGLTVGLLCVRSHFFVGTDDRPNAQVLALPDLPYVTRIDGPVSAEIAFFHHPLAFFHGVETGHPVTARRAFVVAHHPAFRGDGSLEYDPVSTNRRISADFGCWPWWAPVSGTVRAQLRSFSPLITMASEDWHNTFDPADWQPRRPVFDDGSAVVGRHGRPDFLKWPATRDGVVAPLTPGPDWRVRVMGCPGAVMADLGVDTGGWELLEFNAMPVADFLDTLDVFAFFYHPRWVEAFGRTVAEAILMERLCVLDPRLQSNFGDLAAYCRPDEAPALMARLREAPVAARELAADRRVRALELFGNQSIAGRIARLRDDPGTRSRSGPKSASIPVALRKVVGLARRRMAAEGRG
ncbi:glycosyltransferase [Marinibacterium sp. SX1]|uniref:glycosyltransferase n=1 Tax=Marinibacterium sp. SX1 TaxID=3388424 RepID=UPI003D183FE0